MSSSFTNPRGYWMPVLHAHLPFVRHPEWADPIEERWLHEAVVESYLPLLEVIQGWRRDNVAFHLTLSLSPPLVAMLDDELLRTRTRHYLETRVELAEHEIFRTSALPEQYKLAQFYRERLTRLLVLYNSIHGDIPSAFNAEALAGGLDLLTCTATHGFLPLLQPQPALVHLQVQLGAQAYQRRFNRPAPGLWNAECGYYRTLDTEFAAAGLNFFFVEAHAIEHASTAPRHGLAAPLRCPAGPAAFGRDPRTSREVWDAKQGYPGDPEYREFHRDIGYDLELDYIAPYIHDSGLRLPTGLKYHAVTGNVGLGEKKFYDPVRAAERIRVHAQDFAAKRHEQIREWSAGSATDGPPPLICSPFDAELFGHWWFEGPAWLDHAMRELCAPASSVCPIRPTEYLARHGQLQQATPAFSSWGEGGYSAVWLAEHNRWIYPLLHKAGEELLQAVARTKNSASSSSQDSSLHQRVLNQFTRELLLAHSSDWAFLITMGTAPEYAEQRTRDHLAACTRFATELASNTINPEFLTVREAQYNIFPWLDAATLLA